MSPVALSWKTDVDVRIFCWETPAEISSWCRGRGDLRHYYLLAIGVVDVELVTEVRGLEAFYLGGGRDVERWIRRGVGGCWGDVGVVDH